MPSIKLSVTVRAALEKKYGPAELKKIDTAVAAWIAAEKARGIDTVHLALDDKAAMGKHGVTALAGKVTPHKCKRALDALFAKMAPDYVVLFGGADVVPYFEVANPSFDPSGQGDDDRTVLTDNPYASSHRFDAGNLKSYLVPDRVVGRLTDLPATAGRGDPTTLLAQLKTATQWKSKPKSFFKDIYATCCDDWKAAGIATLRYLDYPVADLLVSPPARDGTPLARKRLARKVHVTKCHGVNVDAHFYGQKKKSYPEVLFSGTVEAKATAGTIATAMCCFGANVYAPSEPDAVPPGALPIPIAYLHQGALGFLGATKIAWVGDTAMLCADWIVAAYVKQALAGASQGRALLESKQDYMRYLVAQGINPDTADEKTLLEFVLLGDPALHPTIAPAPAAPVPAAPKSGGAAKAVKAGAVTATMASAAKASRTLATATLRAGRRAARALVATQVERALPTRVQLAPPAADQAKKLFQAVAGLLPATMRQKMDPARVTASELLPPPSFAKMAAATGRAVAAVRGVNEARSREYTWSARSQDDNVPRIVMLKVEADADGNVVRTRTLHSA